MKKYIKIFTFILLSIVISGCSDSPSSSQKDDQYKMVDNNVKTFLGDDYEANNFTVVEEGYTNEENSEYVVKFTFDLNKEYLLFDGKKIPGELKFSKIEDEWKCNFNSGNVTNIFNLLESK